MTFHPQLALVAAAALAVVPLAGCLQSDGEGATVSNPPVGETGTTPVATPKGTLQQAGSSTVYPIAEAWAEELAPTGLQVVVAGGGSGAGASKLCAKEIQLGDMSRAMKDSEKETCAKNGVKATQWTVAFDGLTVVVNKANDFVDHLTVAELEHVWRPVDPAQTWADVRAGWPAEKIVLYGPDSDSGTYEYFNEEILGKKCGADGKQQCGPRSDFTPSPDDNILVEGVAQTKFGIGHFGFAYFTENQERLKAVPIVPKGGSAAVAPSFETIADGSYKPLGRPIFIYTDGVPPAGSLVNAYLSYAFNDGQKLIREVGYVELDSLTLAKMKAQLATGAAAPTPTPPPAAPKPTGTLQQAGSSTVYPIAEAWAEELAPTGIQVVVAGGGSGAGASKICAKEIQLGDMSRTMKQSEIDKCRANGVEPVAWTIAFDGLTVVLSQENDFVDHLTVEELDHIWRPVDPAQTWADVRAGWPAEKIALYGPDSDSGTYEYFNEEILGKKCGADGKQQCGPRSDYTPSPDDNVLVEGVASTKFAIGHFGFAYYEQNKDRLKAAPIVPKGGTTAVSPSFETIADGSYSPLGRPIFIVTNGVPAKGSLVHAYLSYAFGEGQDIVREVGYVELDPATLAAMNAKL